MALTGKLGEILLILTFFSACPTQIVLGLNSVVHGEILATNCSIKTSLYIACANVCVYVCMYKG